MRLTALFAAALLMPAAADARPKKKAKAKAAAKGGAGGGACGVTLLPLVAGNVWTYSPVVAPLPPLDAIKRISPVQPKQIVITVKSVEDNNGETVATLEEKLTLDFTKDEKKPVVEERTISSTVTCTDKKFDISPDSFFFAGEPGGFVGLDITKLERIKGTSWQLVKGAVGEDEWREDLVMQWAQTPTAKSEATLGSGKLELERRFTPQELEPITTKMGMYRAEKLGLVTTGRVTLENATPQHKPMELPANWVSQLWIVDSIGMVQALNSFGHMYQLVDMQLAGAPAPEDAKPVKTKKKK